MKDFRWEDAWHALALVVAVLSLVVIAAALGSKHRVDGYYLGTGQHDVVAFCAIQSIQWDEDKPAFCSDDISRVLSVIRDANAALVGK